MAAPAAARILARRFSSRDRYRRNRDKKIAVDFIGKTFRFNTDQSRALVRLVEYDPATHQVVLMSDFLVKLKIDTDKFWQAYRSGKLVEE